MENENVDESIHRIVTVSNIASRILIAQKGSNNLGDQAQGEVFNTIEMCVALANEIFQQSMYSYFEYKKLLEESKGLLNKTDGGE